MPPVATAPRVAVAAALPASVTVVDRAAIAATLRVVAGAVRADPAVVEVRVAPVVVVDPEVDVVLVVQADVVPVDQAVAVAVRAVLVVDRADPAVRVVGVVQPARHRSNLQWQTAPRTSSVSL